MNPGYFMSVYRVYRNSQSFNSCTWKQFGLMGFLHLINKGRKIDWNVKAVWWMMEPRIGKKLNILSPYGFLYSFDARWQEKLTEQTTKWKFKTYCTSTIIKDTIPIFHLRNKLIQWDLGWHSKRIQTQLCHSWQGGLGSSLMEVMYWFNPCRKC